MTKLVIFDWDGTIEDTADVIVSCMRTAAELANSRVPSKEQIRQIIGLSLPIAVRTMLPEEDPSIHDQVVELYKETFRQKNHTDSRLFPNVTKVFEILKNKRVELAVATGKSRRGLNRALLEHDLTHFFQITKTADDGESKPHPQMLLDILEARRFAAHEAVMVGDTEFDLEMAANAGMRSVGVSYGVHRLDQLKSHNPIAIVDDLIDLVSVI